MGYLKDFREQFAKRLDGLDPKEMQEALNVACNAILESYRNGQKSQSSNGGKEARTEKRPQGNWKKRGA